MADTQQLKLNTYEIVVLTDAVRNDDTGTDDMRVVAYRLLLRLGLAYLDAVHPDTTLRESTVTLTEAEVWLLRSKINSGLKQATDQFFGIRLLRKLYALLVDFDTALPLPEAGENGEQMDEWHRNALAVWKHKEDDHGPEMQPA